MADPSRMPMFPLGTVLMPGGVLPLHVFEPRYRQMTADCLDADGRFGVVLIERGSEVGGGDVRADVGTVAAIVEAGQLDDGRWVLATIGVRRIGVTEWLPDDPYPQALVVDLPDEPGGAGPGRVEPTRRLVQRSLGLAAEAGRPTPVAPLEIADDGSLASYQLAAAAPLGPLDHQRLLVAESPAARLDLLDELISDEIALLEALVGRGDGPDR